MGKRRTGKRQQPIAAERVVKSDIDDDDDEEIDEDEAFNSDDERKYGAFFDKGDKKDNDDGCDDDSDDDDDKYEDSEDESEDDNSGGEDDDGGQYMLDLLNRLDEKKPAARDGAASSSAASLIHVQESQFSASVVPNAGVTLDQMMEGISDSRGFGGVQRTLRHVATGRATSAPANSTVSDRAERKVHYRLQQGEISQWSTAVQQNRNAETLDFRPKHRVEVTRDIMLDQFVPSSDFERQLHAALEHAEQQDEEAVLKAEERALQDDLGANEITIEEYRKRRGQLAKMRALMFYHEQKRHHMNKIKSKKYRRIRKKQREKTKDAEQLADVADDPVLARELEEKEEMERMKERADLAHKNTSKWAKRILKRGNNVDKDTRRALSAQLKRGDDLLKRMNTSGADEDEGSDEEDLVETARKVLQETDQDKEEEDGAKTGLFKMSFMQRGVERQRQRARQEARELLMELEGEFDQERQEVEEKQKKAKKQVKMASKKEMQTVLKEGELVASSLKFGTGSAVTVSGDINIDDGFHAQHDAILDTADELDVDDANPQDEQEPPKVIPVATPARIGAMDEEENPWLARLDDADVRAPKKKPSAQFLQQAKRSARGFVDVDRAVDLLENKPTTTEGSRENDNSHDFAAAGERKITMLSQEELVRKAFAAPSDKEADDEFAKEKALVEEHEDPTQKSAKELDMTKSSGWGSWAGAGAPPPSKIKRKLPAKLQPPVVKPAKRLRLDDKKPAVIISQRRVRKIADKYMISHIPYPFTTREEYERSMVGGIGPEWNVTSSFKDMTRPEILTRSGKIIKPISKKVKQKRAPAKF
jgi:U3 small nucleolar RNA-associated protein 14